MHGLVLLYINHYTIFEVPSFINYQDVIESKIKKRVTCL